MMPIDAIGYQQLPASDEANTSDSDTETPGTLDRALPHSNLPAGQRPRTLNGVKRFLASDETDTDTDESDSEPDDTSDTMNAAGNRVMCRHLALHYCLRSMRDSRYEPRPDDLSYLRRQSSLALDDLRSDLANHSRALHMVCARDLGVFLRQTFNEMAQEHDSADTERLRVYYISTGRHGMALRLVRRPRHPGGGTEHEVSVYDPNFTDHHVQCVVNDLYAFTADPKHHGFLSYILAREEGPGTQQMRVAEYFGTEANPALQMMLYEMQTINSTQAPATVRTDWGAAPRVSLYLSASANCREAFDAALDDVLTRVAASSSAHALKEVRGFDHSVLRHILVAWDGDVGPLQRWRAVWETSQTDLKVNLVIARDRDGDPLGFALDELNPSALSEWIGLLQSMAPSLVLRALSLPDTKGGVALQRALLSPPVLQALDPVLRRCATELPQPLQDLLAFEDAQGITALGRIALDGPPNALPIWVGWLQEWVPAERLGALLSAPDAKGCSALIRAIETQSPQWLEAWTQALMLVPQDLRAALLRALDDEGRPALLRAIRGGKAKVVKAWASCLSVLTPETRAELLAGRDANGQTLLAQQWCDEYPTLCGERYYLRSVNTVKAQHEALLEWGEWLIDVPIDARLDILAGASAAGEPAWMSLARRHLYSEVELLDGLYKQLVPAEHRSALARRLGPPSEEALARLLDELRQDLSVQTSIQVGANALVNWIEPALQQAIQGMRGQQ